MTPRSRLVLLAVLLAVPLALLAACGGAGSSDPAAALTAATPTYSALAIDQTGADASTSSLSPAPAAMTVTATSDLACHPHLFLRTRELVGRVNRHLYKFLRHVEAVMAAAPTATSDTSRTWERVDGGLDRKFTVTETSPGVFSWTLELGPAGGALVTVLSGQIDRTSATGPHQGVGTLTLDLDALHAVLPAEPVAGRLTMAFDSGASSRQVEVTADHVVWEVVDPLATAADLARLEQPRSGHYVFRRDPGVGGSLKITDQMLFLCPANPDLVLADVSLVSRWYRVADGAVHGRSDAQMLGGQLPATLSSVQAVTCHQSASEDNVQAETYWMMKAEDLSGATVAGMAWASTTAGDPTAAACDPALGATVPSLADASSDFDWTAVDLASSDPYPFPGLQ